MRVLGYLDTLFFIKLLSEEVYLFSYFVLHNQMLFQIRDKKKSHGLSPFVPHNQECIDMLFSDRE